MTKRQRKKYDGTPHIEAEVRSKKGSKKFELVSLNLCKYMGKPFKDFDICESKGMEFGDLEDLHEGLCWLFKCFQNSFSIDWTMTGGEYSHGIAYAVMCDDWWFGAANPRP